jgi:lambda family phage portal protein
MNVFKRIYQAVRHPESFWAKPTRRQIGPTYKRFASAQLSLLTADWATSPMHIQQILRRDLRMLKARGRQEAMDNGYAKQFMRIVRNNVSGPNGVTVQSRVQALTSQGLDQDANKAINKAWLDWCKHHCDISGCQSFVQIQGLFLNQHSTEGEFIAIEHWNVGKYGYQLEIIDPEQLDPHHFGTTANGNQIRFGIEFTPQGKPVNYYFRTLDAMGGYQGRDHRIVPASRVIHAFLCEWPGQDRGIPWLSVGLLRMKMVNGYEDAAVTAARVGAQQLGWIKSADGEGYVGDDLIEESDGSQTVVMESEPGSLGQLSGDQEIVKWDPNYPHEQFPQFMKRTLMGIASSLGVPYESLANDREGVNYSSLRSAALEAQDFWIELQNYMIEKLVSRVRRNWMTAAYLKQVITLQFGNKPVALGFTSEGKANGKTVDDYQQVRFQGRRWRWVDPEKDMNANEKAVAGRFTSVSAVIIEQGRDPDEVFQEIADEHQKFKALGITPEQAMTVIQEPAQVVEDE